MTMYPRGTIVPFFAFVMMTALAFTAFAQLPSLEDMSDKERAEATLKLAREKAAEFEIYLGEEARPMNGGFAWQYALAPMNSFEFHAYHRDREVFQKPQLAPPWPNVRDPTKPYMIYMVPNDT